jgi:hypothetical protein
MDGGGVSSSVEPIVNPIPGDNYPYQWTPVRDIQVVGVVPFPAAPAAAPAVAPAGTSASALSVQVPSLGFELYQEVMEVARQRDNPALLAKAVENISGNILRGAREAVLLAASRQHNSAYIYIYDDAAVYTNNCRLDDLIRPSEICAGKLRDYGLPSVLVTLRNSLAPFGVELVTHREIIGTEECIMHGVLVTWVIPD